MGGKGASGVLKTWHGLVDVLADYDRADRIILLHAFSVIVTAVGFRNWTSSIFSERAKSKIGAVTSFFLFLNKRVRERDGFDLAWPY